VILLPEAGEEQEHQNHEKEEMHKLIRLEKVKVIRNLWNERSGDAGQHKDNCNPQYPGIVRLDEVFQKRFWLYNRDHPPIWAV